MAAKRLIFRAATAALLALILAGTAAAELVPLRTLEPGTFSDVGGSDCLPPPTQCPGARR